MDIDSYIQQVQQDHTLSELAEAMNVRSHGAAWAILNEPIWRHDLYHTYLRRLGALTGHRLEMVPHTNEGSPK